MLAMWIGTVQRGPDLDWLSILHAAQESSAVVFLLSACTMWVSCVVRASRIPVQDVKRLFRSFFLLHFDELVMAWQKSSVGP